MSKKPSSSGAAVAEEDEDSLLAGPLLSRRGSALPSQTVVSSPYLPAQCRIHGKKYETTKMLFKSAK
jgi:hypothetical protein